MDCWNIEGRRAFLIRGDRGGRSIDRIGAESDRWGRGEKKSHRNANVAFAKSEHSVSSIESDFKTSYLRKDLRLLGRAYFSGS